MTLVLIIAIGNPRLSTSVPRNNLQISVIAAIQPSSALQVSGISMPARRKAYGAAVHNSSTKKTTQYEIQWIAAAPPGCAHVQNPKVFHFSRTVASELAPEETKAEKASEIKISALSEVAEKLQTDFLQVQVGVVRAKFEDGASWQDNDRHEDSDVFMPSALEADRDKCYQ